MTTASDLVQLGAELARAPDWCGNLRKIGSWYSDGIAAIDAGIAALAGNALYTQLVADAQAVRADLLDCINRVGNQPRLVLYVAEAPTVTALGYAQLAATQATAYYNAVIAAGGTMSDQRLRLCTQTIGRLIDAGLWALIDELWILRCENTAQARVGLKVACPAGTLMNSPVFVADSALSFDGVSSHMRSGFVPNLHRTAMTPTNLRAGCWSVTNVSSGGYSAGANDAGGTVTIRLRTWSTNQSNANLNTGLQTMTGITNGIGLFVASRNDARDGNVDLYINAALRRAQPQVTPTSAVLTAQEYYFGVINSNGVATNFRPASQAVQVLSAGLNDAQERSFFQILYDHLAAVGPAPIIMLQMAAEPIDAGPTDVIVLDAGQADTVRGTSSTDPGAALEPVALTDGRFFLGHRVALDPAHAEFADMLAACPVVPFADIADLVPQED